MKHVFKLSIYLYLLFWATFSWGQARSFKPIAGGKAPEGTERRLALVVGNRDYARPDARLLNPLNDATDMTKALNALGFDVITANNLNLTSFKKAVDDFGSRLADYDVALFYYSGHALQFNGENYLVPIDATLQTLSDTEDDCLRLGRIMGKMKAANIKNNLVFLDACRSNPFPKNAGDRSAPQQGLLIPNNPAGSLVVFATEEGSTADDNGSARNGLFTSELLKHMSIPNLSLSDIVLNTRQGVYARSGQKQLPADYNKMLGAFYFVKTAGSTPALSAPEVEVVKPVYREPTRSEPARPTPSKPVRDLPVGPAMVYVRGGTFSMGSNEKENEEPIHEVTVSNFLMGKYEVTVGEFEQFVDATRYQTDAERGEGSHVWTGSKIEKKGGVNWRCDAEGSPRSRNEYTHPVIHVSHTDAVAYCGWLSKRSVKIYRLPTEAEWEFAAGGGSVHSKYSWGEGEPSGNRGGNIADQSTSGLLLGWASTSYNDGYKYTAPVGQFALNSLSLYDMGGNVSEWCSDWYDKSYYASSSSVNPMGPSSGRERVIRGCGWLLPPQNCRVAYRSSGKPAELGSFVGFRVVSQSQ